MIVGVIIAFMGVTFLVARLLNFLLDTTSLAALFAAWAITVLVGIALVRQLPTFLLRSERPQPAPASTAGPPAPREQ